MITHREIVSSYHHKPKVQGVDYSLFIMETMEKSLEKIETTPAAPRRSFPPPICNSRSLFHGFCVSAALPSERRWETIFIVIFRSRRGSGKKIDGIGGSRPRIVGPTRPRNLAAWAHLSWPSGLRLFASFAPTLRSFQKLMLVNFQVIRTSFGSLKHQNIENRVFCQCRVNSRKIGKL